MVLACHLLGVMANGVTLRNAGVGCSSHLDGTIS